MPDAPSPQPATPSDPDAPAWEGYVVIDKPLGLSSMDVVRRVRWSASRGAGGGDGRVKKTKCGHAGTLDPLATGVVICCVGKATKTIDRFMGLTKRYVADVDLTAFTTTEDREGERTEVTPARGQPTRDDVAAACASFVGESVEQIPPRFSAIHVNGQRAYALARAGEDVKMKPRFVRIDAVELLDYAWPRATIDVTCGKGTYIRSLGRDLGVALGTGGHLAALRRTAIGPFTVDVAFPLNRYGKVPMDPADLRTVPDTL